MDAFLYLKEDRTGNVKRIASAAEKKRTGNAGRGRPFRAGGLSL